MRTLLFASLGALVAIASACSGSSDGSHFITNSTDGGTAGGTAGGTSGATGGGATSGNGGGLAGGSGGNGGTGDGCSDAAKLVYVLSEENDLYSFDPPNKLFTKIGALGCQTGMTPNSMAISRDATAWVNYAQADQLSGQDTGGAIFKVSTKDASCQPTNITLSQDWYRLGMGFSTDTTSTTSETLYVAATGAQAGNPFGGGGGAASPGLGKIDLNAQSLTPIGSFSGSLAGQNAELTGTGDARLFGFFTTSPVVVAEIDKSSGTTSSPINMKGLETPAAWAFSFWGGDFYLYTCPDPTLNPNRTTNVTHYRPSDGSIDTAYMQNIGFRIVGAGVSTCAPVTTPK